MKKSKNVFVVAAFSFFICACAILGYTILNLQLNDEMLPPEAPQRNEIVSTPPEGINMNVCLMIYWFFLCVGIVGIFYLIAMRRGREVLHAFLGAFLAILILIGVLYVMTATNTEQNVSMNNTNNSTATPGNTPLPRTSTSFPLASVLLILGMFVIITVIIVSVVLSYVAGWRKGRKGVSRELRLDFADAIEESVALFETGISTRDAIIRCYKRMTEILAEHGVKDALHLTPREFKEEVKGRLKIESKNLDTLIELFETARYSTHEITEEQKNTAIHALKGFRVEVSS
ncbi:MAG: DUF4129 domain-containing protein [Thermoplasmata archaeon]